MRGNIGHGEFAEQLRTLRENRLREGHSSGGTLRNGSQRGALQKRMQRHIQTERLSWYCRELLFDSGHEWGPHLFLEDDRALWPFKARHNQHADKPGSFVSPQTTTEGS